MHERIVGLYEENAAAFDAQRGRALIEKEWLGRFAALVIARWLIERGFAVTGVDSSPSLIALCGERFPGGEWLVGDMRALDLGRRFDGLIAWHSFFHLTPPDQRPMFERFAAHAAPAAPLLFTSGWSHGEAIGEWQSEPLYHGSLDPADYRALLEASGFEILDHRVRDPACGEATVWLAQINPASGLDGSA
jgi:hypothetical protein